MKYKNTKIQLFPPNTVSLVAEVNYVLPLSDSELLNLTLKPFF